MGLRGSVKAFSLDQVLAFLITSGHQGTLSVFHQDLRRTVYLHEKGLYFERSTWSFRLGEALIRAGAINPEQLDEGLAVQKERAETGIRLGDCLIELGHTTPEAIRDARRVQEEEELYELFGWEDAFFEFEKGVLPEGFEARFEDPDELRFDSRSVLVEATTRTDEWQLIKTTLPSDKRIYVLSDKDGAHKRAFKELRDAVAQVTDPEQVFSGAYSLGALREVLGLSRYDTLRVVAHLVASGEVRPIDRRELESRFRRAIESDLREALGLYECALESPEFETRGRFLDRVLFGSPRFREQAADTRAAFNARLRGKRAFELSLTLFRQGIPCELTAREEGKTLRLGLSKEALVWFMEEGQEPPSILDKLLERSPTSAAELLKVREMQVETGRTLHQLLVGGGYVTMENWFRAQLDMVLGALFSIFFMRRPHVEVVFGTTRGPGNPGLDVEVPLQPWLRTEAIREIRAWTSMLSAVPSVQVHLLVTPKGQKSKQGLNDSILYFDGQRSLAEVMKLQDLPPQRFLADVYEKLQSGRLEPLQARDYAKRLEAALAAGQRASAINFCQAAIASNVDPEAFRRRLLELRAEGDELSEEGAPDELRGDLASFSLAEVLQTLNLTKRSGTLRVEARGETGQLLSRQIYFDEGDIFLLSGELEEQLNEGDLEAHLLDAGLVTEDQIADAAAGQMKDEVYEMFLWEGAEFSFAANVLPPEFFATQSHRKIRLHTVKFLLGAVQRIAEWEEVRRILPSDDIVLAFESPALKMQIVQEKGDEELLVLVDGRHAIADLVRLSRMRRFKALTLLANLIQEGHVKIVDLDAAIEEDEDALFASDLPTSGVIEEGFVGQIQFVGMLQDMASAGLTGVLRVTDGRRSNEVALIDGELFRTQPYRAEGELADALGPAPEAEEEPEEDLSALPEKERKRKQFERMMRKAQREQEYEERRKSVMGQLVEASARETAQDFAECFSWRGTRFELLQDTLPPRLEDEGERDPFRVDPEVCFDVLAEAGERWVAVGEQVPRDLWVKWTDPDNVESARFKTLEHPELADLVNGERTPEDIARISGKRYHALTWLAECFEENLVEGVEPVEEESEEDWDFSL